MAMAVRWGFHLYNPQMSGFAIYQAARHFSDGYPSAYEAINIANGYRNTPEQQPAVRPFYSIVLACLYTLEPDISLSAVTVIKHRHRRRHSSLDLSLRETGF